MNILEMNQTPQDRLPSEHEVLENKCTQKLQHIAGHLVDTAALVKQSSV